MVKIDPYNSKYKERLLGLVKIETCENYKIARHRNAISGSFKVLSTPRFSGQLKGKEA
jgi:hypothetical protein